MELIRPKPITTDKPAEDRRKIILWRPITTNYDRLSIEEKKILLYILDNDKISRKQAVDLLNLGETKIKKIFGEMLIKKLLVRHGKGRSTYYKIANNTEKT